MHSLNKRHNLLYPLQIVINKIEMQNISDLSKSLKGAFYTAYMWENYTHSIIKLTQSRTENKLFSYFYKY